MLKILKFYDFGQIRSILIWCQMLKCLFWIKSSLAYFQKYICLHDYNYETQRFSKYLVKLQMHKDCSFRSYFAKMYNSILWINKDREEECESVGHHVLWILELWVESRDSTQLKMTCTSLGHHHRFLTG